MRSAACSALLACLCLAVYSGTLSNGFVYDDNFQILQNPWIREPGRLLDIFGSHSFGFTGRVQSITYRPLVFVLFMAEYAAFGLEPWAWHLTAVALHSLNAILVFFAGRRLLAGCASGWPGSVAPLVMAAVFACHPVNSEVVAWVSCAPELLYTHLCLLALLAHMRLRDSGGRAVHIVPPLLLLAALAAKETALLIVPAILLYDRLFLGRSGAASLKAVLPHLLAAALYMAARTAAIGGAFVANTNYDYLSAAQMAMNSAVLFARYMGLLVFPVGNYPFKLLEPALALSEPAVLASLALAAALAAIVASRRLGPAAAFSLALLLLPLLPALYIPGVSRHAFADRYLYLPSAGFAMLAALVFARAASKRGAVTAALTTAALLAFSVAASARVSDWKDDISVWKASLRGNYENFGAHYYIGIAYMKAGGLAAAEAHLFESARINRGSPNPLPEMERSAEAFLAKVRARQGARR